MLTSTPCLIVLFVIILMPILMVLDFFGVNITPDGYVENNMEYAEEYRRVLNNYFSNKNQKLKYKNKLMIENSIRNINNEMDEAVKEFSKLFADDKIYNRF